MRRKRRGRGDAALLELTEQFDGVALRTVEVPAELREALRQEPAWRKLWAAQTPGRQRGIAHHVDSARSPETRAARAVEALERLEQGLSVGRRRRGEP